MREDCETRHRVSTCTHIGSCATVSNISVAPTVWTLRHLPAQSHSSLPVTQHLLLISRVLLVHITSEIWSRHLAANDLLATAKNPQRENAHLQRSDWKELVLWC